MLNNWCTAQKVCREQDGHTPRSGISAAGKCLECKSVDLKDNVRT